MSTSIEYRISDNKGVRHVSNEEGIVVRLSAMRSEAGKKAKELDMSDSSTFSTFKSNYESWNATNLLLSSSNIDNVYFQEIVKMGLAAVPYIYEELKKGPTDLVYALDEIFGNPIKYEGFVSLKQSCDLWLSILQKTGKF